MFTGIVSDLGEVVEVDERADGLRRLAVACGYDPATIDIGASIACSGPCLTVVERGDAGRGDVLDELEAAGHSERGRQCGVREHKLSGAREDVLAADGAGRRADLPGVCLLYTSPSPRDTR